MRPGGLAGLPPTRGLAHVGIGCILEQDGRPSTLRNASQLDLLLTGRNQFDTLLLLSMSMGALGSPKAQ